jgi:hypothetical protein
MQLEVMQTVTRAKQKLMVSEVKEPIKLFPVACVSEMAPRVDQYTKSVYFKPVKLHGIED